MWIFKKDKNRIQELEEKNQRLVTDVRSLLEKLKVAQKSSSMADLMRESLGMQIDFSAASNDKCLPPHYLEGLSEDERENFVVAMETIYSDEKFQKVLKYMINLFATNAIYKYDKEEMRAGQIAVIAFRTLVRELDKMHSEFLGYKKVDEPFDEHAIMPE